MTELSNADRICLLAATIEDYLPGPWMGRREWSAEGPSRRTACRRCEGKGTVNERQGTTVCSACAGKGTVLADSYTGRVVAREDVPLLQDVRDTLAAEKADHESRQRRSRRIDGLLTEDRGGEDWADWVLRRKRSQYRSGDYALLERMAASLPDLERVAFWKVHGPRGREIVAGPRLRESAARALRLLDNLMPHCRVPADLLPQRNRDQEIWFLNDEKRLPQAQIARRVGVSVATVSRVLKKRKAA